LAETTGQYDPRWRLDRKTRLSILADNGIAAIWQLHMAAADAHQTGYPAAAGAMLEIAEAAEDAWLRAEGARRGVGFWLCRL